jgi:hypothetical protein
MTDNQPVGVEITDEAVVEEACQVMHDAYERAAIVHAWETNPASRHQDWADVPESNKATMRDAVRALLGWLEAARPFMASRPALDREAAQASIAKATGHVREMDQHEEGECEEGCAACAGWGYPCEPLVTATDSVMALAVPVPTREAIDEVIATKVMRYESAADVRLVDDGDVEALDAGTAAVLALLNGSAK